MDIIRPDIIWISGRCYRVNKTIDSVENTETKQSTQYLEEGRFSISRIILNNYPPVSPRAEKIVRKWCIRGAFIVHFQCTIGTILKILLAPFIDLYGDDDDEDFFHIEQIDRNRFKSNFHVAQ